MGFVVFLVRAENAGRAAGRLFARRLTVLLLIGVAHGVLLWAGDILATYALVGFVLLLFRRSSAKKLMTAFVAIFMFMLLLMPLMQFGLAADREARVLATNQAALAKLGGPAAPRVGQQPGQAGAPAKPEVKPGAG